MKAIDTRRPSRLDLNAPLLSARRSTFAAMSSMQLSRSNSLNNGPCHRVPFTWEQSPGKPKDHPPDEDNVLDDSKAFPLPKPPPFRWLEESPPTLAFHGLKGNNENGEEDDDDDGGFSDVIDLFSLVGSLNTTSERQEEDENESAESDIDDKNGSLSPSFMIQRFLPAATALAASSLSALADGEQLRPLYANNKEGSSCVPRLAGEAYSTSKGCGLEMLFPWRVKQKVCGVKNPVRQPRSRLRP